MILSTLAGLGIDFVVDLIEDKGEDLAIEGVKKITGIDLSKKKELTQEEIESINSNKLAIEQLDFEKLKLELESKKEDNRHEEHFEELSVSDKQNARSANHLHDMQSDIGKTIFIQTSILIPILICIDVVLSVYAKDLELDGAIHGAISTLIGIALNNAYRERQSLIEFLFGSSVGSKMKDKK